MALPDLIINLPLAHRYIDLVRPILDRAKSGDEVRSQRKANTKVAAVVAMAREVHGVGCAPDVHTVGDYFDSGRTRGAARTNEDSGKLGPLGPGASGPKRVVRAQILLDRARFSPGEIDGVYGDDFGIAVKGYQESHCLKPTGVIDVEMWGLLNSAAGPASY